MSNKKRRLYRCWLSGAVTVRATSAKDAEQAVKACCKEGIVLNNCYVRWARRADAMAASSRRGY